jgi:hypothetical protein
MLAVKYNTAKMATKCSTYLKEMKCATITYLISRRDAHEKGVAYVFFITRTKNRGLRGF